MINSWYCENIYSGKKPDLIGQDCIVTSSSTIAISPTGTSQNPITVRDDGTLVFGIGIIIFFMAIIFFGLLFNSFNLKK